ncbi:MAG: hypothetical protein JWQ79_1231 [Mucilaginibacter sp.]|nr:hypothetical protein [Mucilaginibacter sp.]
MVTVLGASGFIGSHLVAELSKRKMQYFAPQRNEILKHKFLGDIIYCIGLTADAKYKPHETITAHITKLQEIIEYSQFTSITYCSSTRVYVHNQYTDENDLINVNVNDPFELFNLTKLTAESLLKNTVKNYKIVRLSNVFGNDFGSENFITSILKDAFLNKKIILRTTPNSSKDYIYVDDTVNVLLNIATSENSTGIYNVAYGQNVSNEQILNKINEITGAEIEYTSNASHIAFPVINNNKIIQEFKFSSTCSILDFLPKFIERFRINIIDI